MKPVLKIAKASSQQSELQPASLDIWDMKYRLRAKTGEAVDVDLDATYRRVAIALASVETEDVRAEWSNKFYWQI
jgi:ribonucleoside-diphosphate reductase alpha chain